NVLLFRGTIDLQFPAAGVLERDRAKRHCGEVVVDFDDQGLLHAGARTGGPYFYPLAKFSDLAVRVSHDGVRQIEDQVTHLLSAYRDRGSSCGRTGIVEGEFCARRL